MARRNAEDFGSSRPKITPDDLEEDVAILTVAKVEEILVDDKDAPDGKRKALALTMEETGDKLLWLNKTMISYLIERLGDDDEDWIGQPVPVEKHQSKFGANVYNKVWISDPATWDEIFEEAGIATAKKPKARKVSKPKGRR